MLAAVAVPCTLPLSFKIAPPPMNPMPAMRPSTSLACASELSAKTLVPSSMKLQLAVATNGKVRSPALRAPTSRSHATGSASA